MTRIMSKLAVATLLLSPVLALAAVPSTVAFSARIADGGAPVTGTQSFTFKLFDALEAGNEIWSEPKDLIVNDGVATTSLGDTTALPAFTGAALFLEVTMGGSTFAPRLAIQSVPYALRAALAESMNVPLNCQTVSANFSLAAAGGRCPTPILCLCVIGDPYCKCDNCDSAACPAGYTLTGGGYVGDGTSENFSVLISSPSTSYWRVRAINNDASKTLSLYVYSRCCKVP